MANGAFKFKDNSGNVVSFISGSGSNISFSGGTLDLSGMTGLTLGNLTLSGTTQNALSASHAASYLLTSSFNTYSGTTDTVIGTLQTSTSSLNSFTSSATTRLNSIETSSGSLNSYTSSNNTKLGVIESTTASLNSYTSSNTTNINAIHTSTGSLNTFTSSATTRLNSIEGVSGSYATTGSNQFKNDQVITGSLTVTGFIDAQELRTTYISSSILYRSGSTKFGDELSDTHAFTGSLLVSGTISVPGSNLVSGSSQVLNGSGVWSGSAQLPSGTVSGSVQVDVMSTTNIARLATTGSNVFTGAITGTTATLSGAITSKDVYITNSANADVLEIFQSPSILNSFIDYPSGRSLILRNKGTAGGLTLASTGAATFSSSISATSATFSGDLRINNNNWLVYTDSTATARNILTLASNDNLYLQYKAGSNFYLRNTDGDLRLTIDSAGAFTFSGKIAFGTTPASEQVRINQTTGNNSALLVTTTGIAAGQSYGLTVVAGTNSSDRSFLVASQASVDYFKIRGDGAATFSSSVNVIGVLTVGNAVAATNIEFNLSGVSGKAKRIQFQDGATGQWLLGQGAASETSAFELYNATGTIVLSVNKSTNISTFNGSTTFAAKTNGNNVTLSGNGTALEMYNTSGTVKNWQISSQTHNSQCIDITPSTTNGGTTYSTPVLTIDGEQNRVGIGTGTSRPLTLFHTYSDSDNLSTFQAGSSSGIQLRFRHGSTLTGFINSNTTNIFSVYNTNSTELVSVTPGGDVFHYGGTSNQGLWTFASVGTTTGQGAFNFDVSVGDEGGGGNIFKVEAGFAHYYGMSYNCLAEFYISTRGTGSETTDIIRRDTALAGSFTASKPNAYTLRVTKNAGTYPGGGKYWIRVTKVTY
jgi:hypothetical protein